MSIKFQNIIDNVICRLNNIDTARWFFINTFLVGLSAIIFLVLLWFIFNLLYTILVPSFIFQFILQIVVPFIFISLTGIVAAVVIGCVVYTPILWLVESRYKKIKIIRDNEKTNKEE